MSLDKLTEPKLANFAEIDAYIIISCPYSTFYDMKDFYKVIINPFELEFAVANVAWKNYILSDLSNIVKEEIPAEPSSNEVKKEEDEERKTDSKDNNNGDYQLIKT